MREEKLMNLKLRYLTYWHRELSLLEVWFKHKTALFKKKKKEKRKSIKTK
jgi:hypothetical protein